MTYLFEDTDKVYAAAVKHNLEQQHKSWEEYISTPEGMAEVEAKLKLEKKKEAGRRKVAAKVIKVLGKIIKNYQKKGFVVSYDSTGQVSQRMFRSDRLRHIAENEILLELYEKLGRKWIRNVEQTLGFYSWGKPGFPSSTYRTAQGVSFTGWLNSGLTRKGGKFDRDKWTVTVDNDEVGAWSTTVYPK